MDNDEEARPIGVGTPASRQVNWYETFEYTERLAAHHDIGLDYRLIAGTPQWCGMADDDARKLLALVLGGVREALGKDTRQEAMADASTEISCAADWSALAREIVQGRGAAYITRRKDVA